MCSYFIVKILIQTLLLSLFIVPNRSHAKSSKKVADNNLAGNGEYGISGLLRGKRDLISDLDEEMDEEEVTTEASFGYGGDVETTTTSFSTMDADEEDKVETSTLPIPKTDSNQFKDGLTSLQSTVQILQSTLQNVISSLQSTLQSVASSLQRPSEVSKESSSGIKRLLEFMERQEYNPYEIPKRNWTNSVLYRPGDPEMVPVSVEMYLNIRSVSNIDEINEQVSLDIDLITHWWDGMVVEWYFNKNQTLKNEYKQTLPEADNDVGVPLDSKILKNFWTPDIYIERLAKVSTSKILSRSERLKFNLNGDFNYVKRMTVKVNCEMDFTYYPADTQKCDFTLRSYSYNANDLRLSWRLPEGVYLLETDDSNFDLQVVDVMKYRTATRKKRYCLQAGEDRASCAGYDLDPEEDFEVLRFTLQMRRKISYQLLQTYIPSALYIAITWLCFMIPPKLVEGRIAIAMTTLLTLTGMFSSVRENTPIVSYIKAIDIWMAAGIVFIFLVLLKFTVLLWTESGKKSKEELEASEEESVVSAYERFFNWLRGKATTVIGVVEYYSFVIILFMTVSFNIAYWTWLFVVSGYFSWSLDDWHNANNGSKYEEKMGDQLECPACHNK